MKKRKMIFLIVASVVGSAFLMGLLPFRNPVVGATTSDYHPQSFWYYPWGTSVTHYKPYPQLNKCQ